VGLSGDAVLAQAYQVNLQTIANVALLEIDLKVASLGANGVIRYRKERG
jgi:hypothetical protein